MNYRTPVNASAFVFGLLAVAAAGFSFSAHAQRVLPGEPETPASLDPTGSYTLESRSTRMQEERDLDEPRTRAECGYKQCSDDAPVALLSFLGLPLHSPAVITDGQSESLTIRQKPYGSISDFDDQRVINDQDYRSAYAMPAKRLEIARFAKLESGDIRVGADGKNVCVKTEVFHDRETNETFCDPRPVRN